MAYFRYFFRRSGNFVPPPAQPCQTSLVNDASPTPIDATMRVASDVLRIETATIENLPRLIEFATGKFVTPMRRIINPS